MPGKVRRPTAIAARERTAAGSPYGTRRRAWRLLAVAVVVALACGPAAARPRLAAASCGNPVACENALPGTPKSQWDVTKGEGTTIQGFADPFSVNIGQSISFKIESPATAYAIDIYRMGYYGGDGARLEASITPNIAVSQNQPSCNSNPATGLVDCGNWGVSATWNVPATAVSGVYFAHIYRTDGTSDENQIPFVVTNNASHSDVVFMTSDETWQAYNDWGGYSLYTGTATDTPHSTIDDGRAVQVSYNRPFATRFDTPGGQDFFFATEFPMVQFLEKNGYDISYVSQQDVSAPGAASMLEQHKVFVNAGHSEYWDAGDRANVTAARDAGVNLAFFAANLMWWKTRWAASQYGNEADRTLVGYKESLDSAQTDPDDPPTWTGAWRDPRFDTSGDDGGQPENALTGQLWLVNCCSYAMQVPAAYAKLRFWRNTSVASLQPGQTATMPGETLGYEWDSDVDNGFRPAGEIDMSKTTENVSELLLTPDEELGTGNASNSQTLYRAASGALVFDAGTVQWAWGLESVHDGDARNPPSPAMQQATVNVLADMGAQPATLETDLVQATASTDTTPPTSVITSPSAGATFGNGAAVTVSGTAVDSGVVAGVEVSTDGGSTWHPVTTMSPAGQSVSWSYTWSAAGNGPVTIMSRATDDSGNIERPAPGIAVTVNCPCSLFGSNYTPAVTSANDSSRLELGMKFQSTVPGWVAGVRFYKGAGNTGTHTGSLWTSGGALLATGTFTNETASGWQTMTFATPAQISANTTYVVSYYDPTGHYGAETDLLDWRLNTPPLTTPRAVYASPGGGNGVFNTGGHGFPASTYHGTSYAVDVIFNTTQPSGAPPTVTGVTPSPGSSSNPVSVTPAVTFSKPMMPSTASFTVTDPNGNSVPGTTTFDSTNTIATFTPTTSLAANTTYTATISGAKDSFGQTMTPGSYTYTFKTGTVRPPGQCPCSIWPDAPPPGASDAADGAAVQLGVKFQAANSGTISGIRFYKEPDNNGTHTGSLWTSAGTLLATGTFTNESNAGWQELDFPTPVAITAGTTYVASYFAPGGHYAITPSGLSSAVTSGPLSVPAGGGVYVYGTTGAFPSRASTSNYWVDVVYTPAADPVAPSVTATAPLSGQTSVSTGTAVTFTFSKAVQPSTIGFTLAGPGGISVPGTLTYNSPTNSATFVPTSTLTGSPALAPGTTYTATVSGAQNISGTAMPSPYTWSFTTVPANPPPGQCPCSIWPGTAQPAVASANDANAVNVGVKFKSDTSGWITGIRFYKGAANSGAHVGSLWSSSGTLLSQVSFTSESTAGWQQASFPAPIAVTAGTTYVASYFAPHGDYAVTAGGFTSAGVDNPPLHALQSATNNGNGVYLYKSSPAFPTTTFNASNYWVDIVFATTASGARGPAATLATPAAAGTMAPVGPAAAAKATGLGGPPAVATRAASRPTMSPRLARALTGWNSGRGGAALAAVTNAVGDATQAAGLRFYATMRQACGQVAAAVAAAKPSVPIPDSAMQHRYSGALAKFARAAANCQAGISAHPYGDEDVKTHESRRVLARSIAEFTAGGTELYRATASIKELARSGRR